MASAKDSSGSRSAPRGAASAPGGLSDGEPIEGGRAARIARLREMLQRTSRRWKRERTAAPTPPDSAAAEPEATYRSRAASLAAKTRNTIPGEPFERHDHRHPLAAPWGGGRLAGLHRSSDTATARLLVRDGQPGVDLSRAVFLDTETSGLAGGTGTFTFLIGVGRVEDESFRITQFLMRTPAGEPAMLEALREVVGDRPDVVTYNGASFDLPLLATRFALTGAADPFRGSRHLDLLHPARRLFKPRFRSARLLELEREMLRVERDDDIPGARIPQVFFEFLRRGRHPMMPSVLAHNRADILSLAALTLAAVERMEEGWDTEDPADLYGAAGHFARRGEEKAAVPLFERALARGLGGAHRDDCLLRLGETKKRLGDWDTAASLWVRVSDRDSRARIEALRWLAKWEEHQKKDPERALLHVEDALERLPRLPIPPDSSTRYRRDLDKRASRLRRALVTGSPRGGSDGRRGASRSHRRVSSPEVSRRVHEPAAAPLQESHRTPRATPAAKPA